MSTMKPVFQEESAPATKRKKAEDEPAPAPAPEPAPERGPLTPVQYEDDGWGDTPVQMRG